MAPHSGLRLATRANLPRSFYALSKANHPDHNPSNPKAAEAFVRISEAYSILGTPAKRAAYDRDVLHIHEPAHRRHGSYHSTSPAGGRSPSGLSRRRGTFQGSPPSFYRSGGWGTHSEKRREAHESSTGGAGAHETKGTAGGMGPGQDPFRHPNSVPHFDKEAHTRTHEKLDQRMAGRATDKGGRIEPESGMLGSFLMVSCILALGVGVPMYFMSSGSSNKKRKAA